MILIDNIKDLIKNGNLYSLCFVFFNISNMDEKNIVVTSKYSNSKFSFIKLDKKLVTEINDDLINLSKLDFVLDFNKDVTHKCIIKNNLAIPFNQDDIFNAIYSRIQYLRTVYMDDEFKKAVVLSLFVLRGSADFTTNFFAVDIFRKLETKNYLQKIVMLLVSSIDDLSQLNFNFRELQNQYKNNIKKRNNQIRIKLSYFIKNWLNDLQKINKYKFNILKTNKTKETSYTKNNFIHRIFYYLSNILNTTFDPELLRYELKLPKYQKHLKKRNIKILNIAKNILENKCYGCKNKYDLSVRSFKLRNSDNYYLEIHHVISFANNAVDQIENLVKLCPPCHKALAPNRAEEIYQKQIIESILKNSLITSQFIDYFVKNNSLQNKVNYIYDKLC